MIPNFLSCCYPEGVVHRKVHRKEGQSSSRSSEDCVITTYQRGGFGKESSGEQFKIPCPAITSLVTSVYLIYSDFARNALKTECRELTSVLLLLPDSQQGMKDMLQNKITITSSLIDQRCEPCTLSNISCLSVHLYMQSDDQVVSLDINRWRH